MPKANSETGYRSFFDRVESEISPDIDQVAGLARLLSTMLGEKMFENDPQRLEPLARILAEKSREVSAALGKEVEAAMEKNKANRRIACGC